MFEPATEQNSEWVDNPHLFVQQSTSLEERITAEKPQLAAGLRRLKELLGEKKFSAYISPLHNINKSGATLLIMTGSEIRRTHIERECLPALKEAFDARIVRVVAMR